MINTDLKNKRIIFFSAHPDDEIAGAGGLMVNARNQGAQIRLILVIEPNEERFDIDGKTECDTRLNEYKKVAQAFNAETGYLALPKYPSLNNENIEKVIKEIREFKPDILIVLSEDERHTEHRIVHDIVMQGVWHAGRPAFPALGIPHKTPTILKAEADNPMREPNFIFDISDVIEEKKQIFNIYGSQTKRKDLVQAITGLNAHRGLMYHKGSYAEAFYLSEFYYG